ncbi:hypothetical protein GWK47_031205 [Chionoecetes opilio]|uniref:Uncharacterized protein n=1 Tax=Chionoecetes opilio TaxID=41210 RepID=A0A8J4YJ33_CHIOP|nr:hypothetical protein GWK47_031205 [Chionoecetes opilio]
MSRTIGQYGSIQRWPPVLERRCFFGPVSSPAYRRTRSSKCPYYSSETTAEVLSRNGGGGPTAPQMRKRQPLLFAGGRKQRPFKAKEIASSPEQQGRESTPAPSFLDVPAPVGEAELFVLLVASSWSAPFRVPHVERGCRESTSKSFSSRFEPPDFAVATFLEELYSRWSFSIW